MQELIHPKIVNDFYRVEQLHLLKLKAFLIFESSTHSVVVKWPVEFSSTHSVVVKWPVEFGIIVGSLVSTFRK